jgi:hypothetical protein
MLKTKAIAPSPIKVRNGTKLRNKLVKPTLSMTILAVTYSQRRRLYSQNVKNSAFFFFAL